MNDHSDAAETAPIWMHSATTIPPGPRLHSARRAELVVVGGGIAGLAAAYYAARALRGATIILLEADRVGGGSTGRSTGIVTPGMKIPVAQCRSKHGDAAAIAAYDASQRGVALLRDLVRTENIDCAARDEIHTRVALTEAQCRHQHDQVTNLGELGIEQRLITGAALDEQAGQGYISGIEHDALLVDPYQLAVGLAEAARRAGVEIYERTRVVAVDTGRPTPVVETEDGRITTPRVLLATNGYGEVLNPHPRSVFALRGYALATAPLTDQQLDDLGWNGRGAIIDERNFFNHYRLTPDHRLLFGGGPTTLPGQRPVLDRSGASATYQRLHREMIGRFPALTNVAIAARWSALEAGTLDRLPVVGQVPRRGGLYYAGAWTGHGLSTSVAAAWQFGQQLAGNPVPPIPWLRTGAPTIPTTFARTKGLAAYLKLLDRADRRDLRRRPPRHPAAERKALAR
ncbi:NAD(P)/FAD-dependent oxidoreductase [Nocardia pseudovaccinii]|uniref:NAD(P)/FAD-dependent oxidoreductase n=1 Tax=Nocardia pseudovaccinii TaxID=189540 RepID=UPI003D8FD571